jgi:hypothetical protein
MVDAFDVSPEASRVVADGGAPVAFAMLAIRDDRGWIGGMGVVASARGRGLGTAAMEAVIEEARRRRLARVDLEVLVQNRWAIAIYERLGFRTTRTLEVLERPAGSPAPEAARPTGAATLDVDACLAHHDALHAFERLPWQRGLPLLHRIAPELEAIGVADAGGPAAALLLRPGPGRAGIADLGLSVRARPGALEACLAEAVRRHGGVTLSLLNLERGHPAGPALRRHGFEVRHVQHEMTLAL